MAICLACLRPDAAKQKGEARLIRSSVFLTLAALALAACDARTSNATEAAPVATPALTPSPDEEAASIPTINGIPTVPFEGPVNFLDALDAQPVYRMPAEYNINHTAIQLTKEEETLQLEAYELGGYWQIGYGHLMLEGEKDTITEPEAEAFLVKDLAWCEQAIERYVTIPITLNEFSALVAFCYNVGSGKTRGSSIVKRLNGEDRPGAANGFLLWNRMNGKVMEALAKRRAKERALFITP